MLGGFLMLRRSMLAELGGFDEGFRLYGEDIDLQYRAMLAGWERWYVPAAVVSHEHKAETDTRWLTRRTLWHWRGIARFVRKHPETAARALAARGESEGDLRAQLAQVVLGRLERPARGHVDPERRHRADADDLGLARSRTAGSACGWRAGAPPPAVRRR